MLKGETVATGALGKCSDDGCPGATGPMVCQNGAGFYIGYMCDQCGPYSRESGYFATHADACKALAANEFSRFDGFDPSGLTITRMRP